MCKGFPHKPAPTAAGAYFQQRRAEFDADAANRALSAMRRAQLRIQFRSGQPSWSLTAASRSPPMWRPSSSQVSSSCRPTPQYFPTCCRKPGGTCND